MAGKAFELAPALHGKIHELRRTHQGIQYLKQTGQFREYMQEYINDKQRPFIAWDGEGWTDNDGEHRYMLLQSSTGEHVAAPQLSTVECLELLLKVARQNPKTTHVIFGGGYDATHILRDLPEDAITRLKETGETRYSVPRTDTTKRNEFYIKYIPHKWLEIVGFDWHSRRRAYIKIFDVMTFFQSSFIKALQTRGIEVPEIIATGKAARSDFTYHDMEEIRLYCQQELELLVRLCNSLRSEFDEAGIYVTQYHGPGAVATAIFKEHKVKEHKQPPPLHIEKAAQVAYFGGRFEQFNAGHYDGPVYLYDINSAYPHKIRDLPSLAGAEWEYTETYSPDEMGLWYCQYSDENNNYNRPHPLPWRGKNANVGFPAHNAGVWLWHHEAKYATTVTHGYILRLANDKKPFAFVEEMYNTRRKWKREGRGGERALKLGMNSLYGKMAQRIGGSEKHDGRPPWHQLEWAGMVTSATRAQLWEAIQLAPESIIAVETDSIMSTVPLDLDLGENLGQWGLETYDYVTYIQSGIYFTDSDNAGTKTKTRGIDVKQLSHPQVLDWLAADCNYELRVNSRQFIGLTNQRKYLYGQWTDTTKELKLAGSKRIHNPALCQPCKNGETLAENKHELMAAPWYGTTESKAHPLPWLDGIQTEDPEMTAVSTEAIEDYDLPRRAHKVKTQVPLPQKPAKTKMTEKRPPRTGNNYTVQYLSEPAKTPQYAPPGEPPPF